MRTKPADLKSGFIEILLIFIGVTIAVAFGNLNDKRKQMKLEHNYLDLLYKEVSGNKVIIDRMISKYDKNIDVLKKIMDLTGPAPAEISMNSFDSLLFIGLSSPNFELINSISNELISSGNGNVIEDINLRIMISEWNNTFNYYNTADQKKTLEFLEKYIYESGSFTNLGKAAKRYSYSKELKPGNFFNIDNRRLLGDPVFQNLVSDHLQSYIRFNEKYNGLKLTLDSLSVTIKKDLEK
jgi:hypothetical protein